MSDERARELERAWREDPTNEEAAEAYWALLVRAESPMTVAALEASLRIMLGRKAAPRDVLRWLDTGAIEGQASDSTPAWVERLQAIRPLACARPECSGDHPCAPCIEGFLSRHGHPPDSSHPWRLGFLQGYMAAHRHYRHQPGDDNS